MADSTGALADVLTDLARVTFDFGTITRITYHPDGIIPETDTTHTVMLGLVACALAERYAPHLDRGRIAQYALGHDLPEVFAGDTPTLVPLSSAEKAGKAAREAEARARLARDFAALPWLADTIESYEQLQDPEALWVKAVDKLLPKLAHLLNGGTTLRERDMSPADVAARYRAQGAEIAGYVPGCEPLHQLRAELVDRVLTATALRARHPAQQRIRHTAPGARPPITATLTPRQTEVLALVADGATNQQVAEHLRISMDAVKRHMIKIRVRLGARSRAHCVHVAHLVGALPAGAPAGES